MTVQRLSLKEVRKEKDLPLIKIGNVVSLFDGIGTGALILKELNIKYDNYYSSEVHPDAVAITKYHFPEINHLGDITKVPDAFFKSIGSVDLLIGGSPCQDFSFAGTRRGMVTEENVEVTDLDTYLKLKKEGFNFKGESYLFWEYIRVLRLVKPKYFLLENVIMSKKWRNIIDRELGAEPAVLNSSNFSGQNRKRNYWFNWAIPEEIPNYNIHVIDILEPEIEVQRNISSIYFPKVLYHPQFENRFVLEDIPKKIGTIGGEGQAQRIFSIYGKSPTITGSWGGQGSRTGLYYIESGGLLGKDRKYVRYLTINETERLQTFPQNYTRYGVYNNEIKEISSFKRGRVIGLAWNKETVKFIISNLFRRR